jgi:hypothetical protein
METYPSEPEASLSAGFGEGTVGFDPVHRGAQWADTPTYRLEFASWMGRMRLHSNVAALVGVHVVEDSHIAIEDSHTT